jgi:aminoglycoside/choline kinase family phosphotransferase
VNALTHPHGWNPVGAVGEDGSPRRYTRVEKNGRTAIIMECPAGIPGHNLTDFLKIGGWLRGIGLQSPEIYEADEKAGYAIIEDFGDLTFKKAIGQGVPARDLYMLAADVLEVLNKNKCPLDLPDYYESHVHKGHRRAIDWYVPAVLDRKNPDGLVEEYLAAWEKIEKNVKPAPQTFLHVDFHVQNLMLLPGAGTDRCGILDFQGAMMGPIPYDWGNLLEDARIHVPADLRTEILKRRDEDFLARYRVLTTQFHCRVLGQFIRLAVRDNKPGYLEFIPIVAEYMREALKNPLLAPLKAFFDDIEVDFSAVNHLNVARVKGHIRPDAF